MTKTILEPVTKLSHKIKIMALLSSKTVLIKSKKKSSGEFCNITKIHGHMTKAVNRARLKITLEEMKDDGILNGLPRDVYDDEGNFKKDIIKKMVKDGRTELKDLDKRAGELYRITSRGREKFNKILTDCLDDPYLQKFFGNPMEDREGKED